MPHPHQAVTWTLRRTRLPGIRLRCAGCAAPSSFAPTGRFRVNANGKSLDVWLLLRCTACGNVVKATVVERSPVRSVDPAALRRYHHNDPELVAETLLAPSFCRRNRLTLDWTGSWELAAAPIPRWRDRRVAVRVEAADPIPLRPEQVIARGLRTSRREVDALIAAGAIRLPATRRTPAAGGFTFTIDGREAHRA